MPFKVISDNPKGIFIKTLPIYTKHPPPSVHCFLSLALFLQHTFYRDFSVSLCFALLSLIGWNPNKNPHQTEETRFHGKLPLSDAGTMGSLLSCFSQTAAEKKKKANKSSLSNRVSNPTGLGSSNRWNKVRSSKKDRFEESLIQEQAALAALLLQQHQQQQQQQNGGGGGSLTFDRSASVRYPASGGKKQALPRSSSSRARSLTDPLLQPQQLVNQVLHEFVFVKDLCFYVLCEENCWVL